MLAFGALICAIIGVANADERYACASRIFCQGEILHSVLTAKLYADQKNFVDMRMKHEPAEVEANFQALGANVTIKYALRKFVNENFIQDGYNWEEYVPKDWVAEPEGLKEIKDAKLRKFAFALNGIWKKLGRNITQEARDNSDRSSLIIVQNPFIIPGGRFREYYYWDSYWILHGILTCGMQDTAQGMIENFLDLVRRYGFVPNGGRIYYLNRSQPPFLIQMVDLYYSYTKDQEFIRRNLGILVKEYEFWERERNVTIKVSGTEHSLAAYRANMTTPRPESYSHDYNIGEAFKDEKKKEQFYQDVASAAESGWDFSSRWFSQSGSDVGKFESIHTTKIIPVDLNSILYKNSLSLVKFFKLTGDQPKASEFQDLANKRRLAINALMWDEAAGIWADYDISTQTRTQSFYASMVVPLWAGIARDNPTREERMFKHMKQAKVLDFPGGLPTSLNESGQQWDFPNAWPPLQHMFIVGLHESSSKLLQNEAMNFAQSWILSNLKGYEKTKYMYEKYNVTTDDGNTGRGGEYSPQVGFGWTNGVILDLLVRFPHDNVVGSTAIHLGVSLCMFLLFLIASLLASF